MDEAGGYSREIRDDGYDLGLSLMRDAVGIAHRPERCGLAGDPAKTRTMDLAGLTDDERLVLWSASEQVRPISVFPSHRECGRTFIKSGPYVIEAEGHAVTVHCSDLADGRIDVQFMCIGGRHLYLPRKAVEAMLLGQVIPDPVAQAQIRLLLHQLSAQLAAQQDTLDRQRGRI